MSREAAVDRQVRSTMPLEHYWTSGYLDETRFISLGHQVMQCTRDGADNILEIGPGNGMLSAILRAAGRSVVSADIDPRTSPNIVASVLDLPLPESSVDAVCAYQVLEHLPFQNFSRALHELRRVSRRWVFLSLPDNRRSIRFLIDLPIRYFYRQRLYSVGRVSNDAPDLNEHFWEIGRAGVGLRDVVEAAEDAGLVLKQNYRIFLYPYHHFFEFEV